MEWTEARKSMPIANKEKKKAYDNEWRRKNKERVNERARLARAARREEYNAKVRKWTKENKDHIELTRILRTYNISKDDFLELKARSNGECSLCGQKDKLVVDHCHTTNKVRSLLCNHCNWGLGHFKDSPELLRKAANYLDKHNE